MLYNFHDSPNDLYERMYLNIRLNEELDVRIYSFPMRYQPTNLPDRSHVGEHWSRYTLRSLQLVLQATQGVVSGEPDFFRAAFGGNGEEFEELLFRPHHMIFNRHWFERFEGRGEFDDYRAAVRKLSASERLELLAFLSSRNPSEFAGSIADLPNSVQLCARFYVPYSKQRELEIRRRQRELVGAGPQPRYSLPVEQIVEDAGLEAEEAALPIRKPTSMRRRA